MREVMLWGANIFDLSNKHLLQNLKIGFMKKIILAVLLLGSVSSFAHSTQIVAAYMKEDGRHISPSQVPVAVKQSFNDRYPSATNVRWEVEREDGGRVYQAEFNFNGRHLKAQFAPDGTFLGQKRA
jgi:hypothetical protein